ncbi:MAG: ParB/RepB/Spo0J family partition protein [Alphaproteobacteria bacterium]|jgi:ParB family chromosome partitioning protein
MSDDARRRLGRGLSALLGDETEDYASLDKALVARSVPIESLAPGRFQPRRHFDETELAGLADSIREKGVLQPIVVRRQDGQAAEYEIIAGERRWRAAQRAQLHEVPVLVRDLSDQDALEIALIENLQREDLNAIEEANAYQRLMDEFAHTQEALSKTVGRSRSHVANTLRLLGLPEPVQALIVDGSLSAGHARTLIGAADPEAAAHQIVARGLSVREAEQLAQSARPKPPRATTRVEKDADTVALERDLSGMLGLTVSIRPRGADKRAGSLMIEYKNLDQLDDVLQRLSRGTGSGMTAHDIVGGDVRIPGAPRSDKQTI